MTRLGIDAVQSRSSRPAVLGQKVDVVPVNNVGVEGEPLVWVLGVLRQPILPERLAVQRQAAHAVRAVNEVDMALVDVGSYPVTVRLLLPCLRVGRHGLTRCRIEDKEIPVCKHGHCRTIEKGSRQWLNCGVTDNILLALPDNFTRVLVQSQSFVTYVVNNDIADDRGRTRKTPPGGVWFILFCRGLPDLLTCFGFETENMAELAERIYIPLVNGRRGAGTTRVEARFEKTGIVEGPLLFTGLRI